MDLLNILQQRYTSKAYDASKRIPQAQFSKLLEALRLSPSSINIQPWHFMVAEQASAKQRIAASLIGKYAYNASKVLDSSHTIVFCSKIEIDEQYILQLNAQEQQDGRFKNQQSQQERLQSLLGYINNYRIEHGDISRWTENQTFIALGQLLTSAAIEGIDATPIGGFDAEILSQQLDLAALGLKPSVIVALGYRSETDFNAKLPKSRRNTADIITYLE